MYTIAEPRIAVRQIGQRSGIKAYWQDEHIAIWKHGDMTILLSLFKHTLHSRFSLWFSKVWKATSCALMQFSLVLMDFCLIFIDSSRVRTESARMHILVSHTEMELILCLMYKSSTSVVGYKARMPLALPLRAIFYT